jgi:hypothetical protein
MTDDDRPANLPMPRTIAEADAMLSDARMILAVQNTSRGSIVGLHRIRTTIDRLLDARNRLTGPPVCGNPSCGRVKDRFGTSVWLCAECDMRVCENSDCDRRVLALNHLYCNPCRGTTTSSWKPPQ